MLVGADGLRSTVRQQCSARRRAALCRLCCLARVACGKRDPAGDPSRTVRADDVLPAAGRAVSRLSGRRPDDELRPGHRRYNVIWYRPADEATELPQLLTDEPASPIRSRFRRRSFAANRSPQCALPPSGLLAPQFRAIVRLIDEPILQPIYDLASPRLAFGRVAIIGDAAFVARPACRRPVSRRLPMMPRPWRRRLMRERCRGRAAPLRGGTVAGQQSDHRAGAAPWRLFAGDADRRRARPLGAPQHSRSGARRNRDDRFFTELTRTACLRFAREILRDAAVRDSGFADRLRCIAAAPDEARHAVGDDRADTHDVAVVQRRERVVLRAAEAGIDEDDVSIASGGNDAAVEPIDSGIVAGRHATAISGGTPASAARWLMV